jgi:putative transposase
MIGYSNLKIAEMMKLNKNTVGIYINTYNEQGPDGLIPMKSPGRPPFLTEEQVQILYGTIRDKTPDEVGFNGVMHWTAKLACLWVEKEFGVKYAVNGMLELFHRINLSYSRPTYVLAKADPEKQGKFKEDFEGVKKNS